MSGIKQFLSECKQELGKVTWPDKNEAFGATKVVLVAVFILTLVVYVLDFLYLHGIQKLLS